MYAKRKTIYNKYTLYLYICNPIYYLTYIYALNYVMVNKIKNYHKFLEYINTNWIGAQKFALSEKIQAPALVGLKIGTIDFFLTCLL